MKCGVSWILTRHHVGPMTMKADTDSNSARLKIIWWHNPGLYAASVFFFLTAFCRYFATHTSLGYKETKVLLYKFKFIHVRPRVVPCQSRRVFVGLFLHLTLLTFFSNSESSTQRDHIQPQTSQCVLHFSIFRQVRNKRCGYKLVVHKKSFLKVLGKLLSKNTCRISAVINSFSVHVEDQSCRLCFLIKLNLSVW